MISNCRSTAERSMGSDMRRGWHGPELNEKIDITGFGSESGFRRGAKHCYWADAVAATRVMQLGEPFADDGRHPDAHIAVAALFGARCFMIAAAMIPTTTKPTISIVI